MSYIDPDALHGAMNDLNNAITDNAATLTAGGTTPATLQAKLKTISDDLGGKKGSRDLAKTNLSVAQQAFVKSASDNYAAFSDLIDSAASGVGKKTPAGNRILSIRVHLNATPRSATSPAPTPAAAKKTA
jgi:hypothetical protein